MFFSHLLLHCTGQTSSKNQRNVGFNWLILYKRVCNLALTILKQDYLTILDGNHDNELFTLEKHLLKKKIDILDNIINAVSWVHTNLLVKTIVIKSYNISNQTGQAPLITDPPPTSFTTLSDGKNSLFQQNFRNS